MREDMKMDVNLNVSRASLHVFAYICGFHTLDFDENEVHMQACSLVNISTMTWDCSDDYYVSFSVEFSALVEH